MQSCMEKQNHVHVKTCNVGQAHGVARDPIKIFSKSESYFKSLWRIEKI